MKSHRFINRLLYLVIQLVVKESKAQENNAGIRCLFVLFLEKCYISQVIHFNRLFDLTLSPPEGPYSPTLFIQNCEFFRG